MGHLSAEATAHFPKNGKSHQHETRMEDGGGQNSSFFAPGDWIREKGGGGGERGFQRVFRVCVYTE